MCRLAIMNVKGWETIDKEYGVIQFFTDLERLQGGDGNGFAVMKRDGTTVIEKGLNMKIKELVDKICEIDGPEWILFHTRMASAGSKCDANCHPFQFEDTVCAMNGTEHMFASIGKMWGTTDTEAGLRTMAMTKMPLPESFLLMHSVFVGFHEKKPFVVYPGSGDLEVINDNGAMVFASRIPWKREKCMETR